MQRTALALLLFDFAGFASVTFLEELTCATVMPSRSIMKRSSVDPPTIGQDRNVRNFFILEKDPHRTSSRGIQFFVSSFKVRPEFHQINGLTLTMARASR